MGRGQRRKFFASPAWTAAVRSRFLNLGRDHRSPAIVHLATSVREGRITLQRWAEYFDVDDTWLESWAGETLSAWESGACPPPVVRPNSLELVYPRPREEYLDADIFRFVVSEPLPANPANVWGHAPRTEPTDDLDNFWLITSSLRRK
jgi:hypothetical protein